MKEISDSCDTNICKGICCTFLCDEKDGKFDDDYRRFLKLHNIDIIEKIEWIKHQRIIKTYLKLPIPCSEFNKETLKCNIYPNRPTWCKINPLKSVPFIPDSLCKIRKYQLSKE